jgi:radical SAM superfamily enzyme YgiQ (UPF0313 family)
MGISPYLHAFFVAIVKYMKTNKVLFITKRFEIELLGIGYLSAGLKQRGFEVDLYQTGTTGNEVEGTARYVRAYKPDIICYNVWTGGQQFFYHLNIYLKNNFSFISIFGGAHATFCTEDVMKQNDINYVVKGEGDYALPKLCEDIRENRITLTPNWKLQNVTEPPQNLDELPEPDRQLLYKYEHNKNNPIRSITSSRGCPYSCSYCYNAKFDEMFSGKKIRFRNMHKVVVEANRIVNDYPKTKYFFFQDDEIGARKQGLKYLSTAWRVFVAKPFHVQMRIEYIDNERIRLLKMAGCNSITFAIESGDQINRQNILGKKFSNEKIEKAVEILHNNKMKFRVENMIGIPFCDAINDMWTTYKYNKQLKSCLSWASLCQPYPSTPLGEQCKREGMYNGNIDDIPEAFFGQTILKFNKKEKRQLENMQRLFTLLVGLKVPKWLAQVIININLPRFYSWIGKIYKERCFKKLYDL